MNAAATARVAAWQVVADQQLAAGTKVTVEDGWVVILPRGGQPTRTPYGPESSLEGLYNAIGEAARAATQAARR